MNIKQAVILAGGKGTRLLPLTLHTPKPMVLIHGKPFLEYILDELKRNGITDVLILVGYLHEKIIDYFKNGKKFGLSITYSYMPETADTGSRIIHAYHQLQEKFILIYGDNFLPFDIKELIYSYRKHKLRAQVTVNSNLSHIRKNNMLVSYLGLVEDYDRKRRRNGLNGIDVGYFIMEKSIFKRRLTDNISLEDDIVSELVKKKSLSAYTTHHPYYSLTSLARLPDIKEYFQEKKIVFLDRDGVINKKPKQAHYINHWKDFVFLPQVKDALLLLKKKGYSIFLFTNQAGIARKMLSTHDLDIIHKKMKEELMKINVTINGIYVCPHGWEEDCFCRKPKPGLLYKAAYDHNINLFKSYCIGDDERDIVAGKSVHAKTFLVNKQHNLYNIVKTYL